MLVGAYAVAVHGLPRATGDIDLWIKCSDDNAQRVWRALTKFGAPLSDLTKEDLMKPGMVIQLGNVPRRIDILTEISGVDFMTCSGRSTHRESRGPGDSCDWTSSLNSKQASGRQATGYG